MEYKIGEVSNILNIPIDTLRYYEKKNIVRPKKSTNNNYRFYEAWDINYLLECKKFRSYDFTLSEIEDILHRGNLNDFLEKMSGRQDYIEERLKYFTLLRKKNEEYMSSLNNIKKNLWKCTFTKHPEIYYFVHRYNYYYKYKESFGELFDTWLSYYPFVENLVEIKETAMMDRQNTNDYGWGFAIRKEYAEAFHLPINDKVKHVKSPESVYTVICAGEKGSFSLRLLDKAMSFIEEKGYKLSGTITGNLLARVHEPEGYFRYIEMWLPVKKS